MKRRISRRGFLGVLGGAALGVGVGLPLYVFRWEPYWLKVERNVLTFDERDGVPSGLRIVHLSDIHRSDIVPDSYIRKCVSKANELEPDLILLTGDYITGDVGWAAGLGELLAPLKASMGVWACLGNHDGGKWSARYGGPPGYNRVREELKKAGIGVLVNENVQLEYDGVPVTIVGMGDLWAGYFDPETTFQGIAPDGFVICLTHNPDTLEMLQGYPVDLFLCGHTHGGQVSVPLVGAPILPIEDTRYGGGLYRLSENYAYVNRGVGLLRKVRFNCRPEISFLRVLSRKAE